MTHSDPLRSSDAQAADLVDQLIDRLQAGRPANVAAVVAEFPEHADLICRLAPAAEVLAALSWSGSATDLVDGSATGTLGDFRILREVGRGGMGVVYEAEQLSLGRRVALKVLPFAAALDPQRLQRFQNEARAAASLHHPSIVPVHAVGSDRGVHYLAMQFIDGATLAALVRPDRLAGADAPTLAAAGLTTSPGGRRDDFYRASAALLAQAADAIDHAHAQGIVHRDVKPGNLLVDRSGKLWVTDFGLARAGGGDLTRSGDLIGTLRYMAPEQATASHGLVDHRADVYALGATLYEVLTGVPAVPGDDRGEVLRRVLHEEPVSPQRHAAGLPRDLETVVLKCLRKDPAGRYPTARELADDLRRFLAHQPIRAKPEHLVHRVRKVARRHPGVAITAAVAVVVGLVLGVVGLAVNNRMVRQEQLRTQDALNRAESQKVIAQAMRSIFLDKLLLQADPRVQADSLRRSGGAGAVMPDLTVRELLDRAADELTSDQLDSQFPGQPLVQAEILATVGEAYAAIGEYNPAVSHLERARALRNRELGPEHPDTLGTVHRLARAHLAAGKPREAALLLKRVRDLRRDALGPGDPDTLATASDLLRCYFRLGEHDKVLELRAEIVGLRRASLGPDHRDTLESMNHLANSQAAVGRVQDALQNHEDNLDRRRRTLGDDHPDTLQSRNNVANCYAALGRYDESLSLHLETHKRRHARLGRDHPDTLQSLNNVAVACSAVGRHPEARRLHDETLTLRLTKLPPGHPDTVRSMNALAWVLATGPDRTPQDTARALRLAKLSVELAPEIGDYWNTLGAAYYRVGDWGNAVEALTASTTLRDGGDAADWYFLAMAHWHRGDKDRSRDCYDRAVRWVETNKRQDEELIRFRAEAAELLGVGRP